MTSAPATATRTVAATLVFSATLLSGCSGPAPARHLVLVTLDTTRADRIGCYGRRDAGTPWLDDLARRGTLFEHAYTAVPLTLPSHVSILTGRYPPHTGVHVNGQTSDAGGPRYLAQVLSDNGFYTAAAIGGFPLVSRFPIRSGFQAYDDELPDPRNPAGLQRDAGEVVAAAERLLSARENRRTFLWVHLFDPHDPYDPPSPFRERFPTDPYQGEIARVDAALADLDRAVHRALDPDGVVFCVVGDHGESLGEHGEDTHGFFLYEATVRVPMIFAGPHVVPGLRYGFPVSTVDIVPTVLGLLGIPAPPGLDGIRLDPGRGGQVHRSYLETELPLRNFGWSPLRAAVDGWSKFIEAPREEIYDLQHDPGETINIRAERHEDADALSRWIATVRGGGAEASPETTLDPRLASLGYVGLGVTPRNGGPIDPKDRVNVYTTFQRGIRALESGDPAAALRLFDALVPTEDAPGLRFQRAIALRMSGRLQDASRELDRVAQADPRIPGLPLERTRIAIANGDAETALREIERYLVTAPGDAEALMFRGTAHEFLRAFEAAERDYRESIRRNPAYRGASLRLAALLVREGRDEEAKAQLRSHLSRFPDDELARGLLGSL